MWMLTCLFTQTNFWLRLRNSLSRQYYLDVSLSNNRLLFSLGIRLSLSTCKLMGLSSFSLLILLFSIFQHSRAVLRLKLFFLHPTCCWALRVLWFINSGIWGISLESLLAVLFCYLFAFEMDIK